MNDFELVSLWVTGISTFGLAVLTGFYVVFTDRIAKESKASAEAAKSAAEAAERTLQLESMAVVTVQLNGLATGANPSVAAVFRNVGRSVAILTTAFFYRGPGDGSPVELRVPELLEPGVQVTTRTPVQAGTMNTLPRDGSGVFAVEYVDLWRRHYRLERSVAVAGDALEPSIRVLTRLESGAWAEV